MKYKAFLFDNDGTLTDSNKLIVESWQYMARKLIGHEVGLDEVYESFGRPLDDVMEDVVKRYNLNCTYADLCDTYREYQVKHSKGGIPVFDGIPETLDALNDLGIKLGVVTSRINDSVEEILKETGIFDNFDAIIGAYDTNIHKPNPEPALLCCQKLGVDPKDALMIGDAVYDIQCGHNAGCKTCFVAWSACTTLEQAIEGSHPDYIVYSPQELLDLVK